MKKIKRKRKYIYITVQYLSVSKVCVVCLQDESSVSTYISIILYDTNTVDVIHITKSRRKKENNV